MDQPMRGVTGELGGAAEQLKEVADPSIVDTWQFKLAVALVLLLIGMAVYRKIRRAIRRRRPVRLHPKLQKYGEVYGEPDERLLAQRRAEAEKILATSTSMAIVGYEVLEQVEAVYVDGFRKPEDALEGLKAVAAMKGANAVINVHRCRGEQGRHAAGGDAVVVRRVSEPRPEAGEAPSTGETAESERQASSEVIPGDGPGRSNPRESELPP
jgi:hypothetical protein